MNQTKNNIIPFPNKNGFPNLETLTNEELAETYKESLMIKEWCCEVEEEVRSRLSAGNKVPQFRMKRLKKGAKRWMADTITKRKTILGDHFYIQKPASPTEIESLGQKGVLSSDQITNIKQYIKRSSDIVGIIPDGEEPARPTTNNLTSDTF